MSNNQENTLQNQTRSDDSTSRQEQEKPLKPEEKPFNEFISNHLIPTLEESLNRSGITVDKIEFKEAERPVVGGTCWQVFCEIQPNRKFWLTFRSNNIKSVKNFALSENGTEPGLLESFLIDEKKITLALLVSRLLQRLNGQKWLGAN